MIDAAFHPLFPLDMGPLHFFSVLGRALFTAQHLEMNCRSVAGFLRMREQALLHGTSVIERPEFLAEIDKLWRKTLGQHVYELTEIGVLHDEVGQVFKEAVYARNEIAHSVAMDVSERLDEELDDRLEHIYKLVRKIAAADKIAAAMIHFLNKEPLPKRDIFESFEDRVVSWVAEETFEE